MYPEKLKINKTAPETINNNNLIEKTKDLKRQFTATGYVVNPERTKLLVIFHNKLQKWLPAGGHVEKNELPHEAALREVFEETGVKATIIKDDPTMNLETFNTTECQIPRPYAILYEVIPQNKKDIEHIHVDFIYAMEAEENTSVTELKAQTEEVSQVKWMTKNEILTANSFDSVKGFAKSYLK